MAATSDDTSVTVPTVFVALDLEGWITINKRRRCPTQTDRATFLGVSRQHLSDIEAGKKRPGNEFIALVMSVHSVPFDRVFFVDKGWRTR